MIAFIVRRSLLALLTIWALSMISFVVIQLPPGDFVDTYILQLMTAGSAETGNVAISESLEKALRTQYGLDQPMFVQYTKWVSRIARGDFGRSLEFQ